MGLNSQGQEQLKEALARKEEAFGTNNRLAVMFLIWPSSTCTEKALGDLQKSEIALKQSKNEATELEKMYFFSLVVAVKMNLSMTGKFCNLDSQSLFERANAEVQKKLIYTL